MIEVHVPTVGESITEGILAEWKVADGEYVNVDDLLFELETDKITMPVAATAAGVVSLKVEAGATVQIGQAVASIDTFAKPQASKSAPKPAAPPESDDEGKAPAPKLPEDDGSPRLSAPAGVEQMREKLAVADDGVKRLEGLSPAVRRLVAENALDPARIPGTGKSGRITKGDVLVYMDKEEPPLTPPLLRRGGSEDEAAARQTRRPMSSLRHRIAERLVAAQHNAAILTTFNEVDMTGVMSLRKRLQEPFQAKYGIKLGIMSFFVKASVEALKAVPAVNSMIEGGDIVENHYFDIGVAVSTEKGLVVPVIRDVDKLDFEELELAIAEYAKRARERTLTLEDLQGGVFTISNGGVFGSLLSTPILNPPQSGILGMHGIKQRPVVLEDGSIAARPMMYLALSYDHRVIDGSESVMFLRKIVECIENPERMMLGL